MLENFLDCPTPESSEGVSDPPTSLPGSAKAVVCDDKFFPLKTRGRRLMKARAFGGMEAAEECSG